MKIVVIGDTSSYESVPQSSGPPEKAALVELTSPKWNRERMRDVTLAEECPRLLKSDEKIHKNKYAQNKYFVSHACQFSTWDF